MTDTHDHAVKLLPAKRLDNTHVLIGESGGLSAVYSVEDGAMGGLAVETEHGTLYLNHEDEVSVLDYPDPEQIEKALQRANDPIEEFARRYDHVAGLPNVEQNSAALRLYQDLKKFRDGSSGESRTRAHDIMVNLADTVFGIDLPDLDSTAAHHQHEFGTKHTNVQQYTADRMAGQWAEGDAITKQQVADLQAAARRIIIHAHEVARLEAQESLSDWLTPEETSEVSEADVQYVKDWLTDWFEGN